VQKAAECIWSLQNKDEEWDDLQRRVGEASQKIGTARNVSGG